VKAVPCTNGCLQPLMLTLCPTFQKYVDTDNNSCHLAALPSPHPPILPPVWPSTSPVPPCSFLFKDQFIELTTAVPQDSDLYGLGETALPGGLLLPRDGNMLTMWARDSAPAEPEVNIYGAHPFYLQLNKGEGAGGMHVHICACHRSQQQSSAL
jgi:alpha-glucosidase (family GH31 glycosyl hydrolase)